MITLYRKVQTTSVYYNGLQLPKSVMMIAPPLSLVLATFFYGLGVGPVCFTLLGELFPIRAKAFCSGTVIAMRQDNGNS